MKNIEENNLENSITNKDILNEIFESFRKGSKALKNDLTSCVFYVNTLL